MEHKKNNHSSLWAAAGAVTSAFTHLQPHGGTSADHSCPSTRTCFFLLPAGRTDRKQRRIYFISWDMRLWPSPQQLLGHIGTIYGVIFRICCITCGKQCLKRLVSRAREGGGLWLLDRRHIICDSRQPLWWEDWQQSAATLLLVSLRATVLTERDSLMGPSSRCERMRRAHESRSL